MNTVSIVIPTYNRSSLLKECLECLLTQTYQDLEIIVVDDGSTDDTRFVIESISDPRLKYYYKKNGGPSTARNAGLAKATGEFIAFLDADDLWPRNYLEIAAVRLAANKEYGAVYTRVIRLCPDGTKKELSTPQRCRSGWITKYFFGGVPCLMPSAILFRRSLWNDIFWDESLKKSEDYDVFLRMSTKTRFLFVPDASIIKRSMPDGLSNTPDPIGIANISLVLERFYFHFQGDNYVSRRTAHRKISHGYRKAAKVARYSIGRDAVILLLKKAISYYPADIRLYLDLLRALLKNKQENSSPDWRMPVPLGRPVKES